MPNSRKGKWQPFDALTGYKDALDKVVYEKGKIKKPTLASEELEELSIKLQTAYNENQTITIGYYHDGYIKKISGIVFRIDLNNRLLLINNNKIRLNDIVSIE